MLAEGFLAIGLQEMWDQMGVIAKLVVLVLVIQSIWSVSVMIERYIRYRKARLQSQAFAPAVAEVLKKGNIQEAIEVADQHDRSHLAKVVQAGLQEFQAHASSDEIPGEMIEASRRACERATAMEREELRRGLGGLATVGSTAPFVGLFGTTVGIINAFTGMSMAEDTGLAAVAAGIAEALVATAMGLFVAIPAVMMYNYFTGKLDAYITEMENSTSELIDFFIKHREKKHV